MPSVIKTPEITEETQEQPSHDTVEVTLTLHPSFVSKITAVLKSMRRNERSAEHSECYATPEMPLDILARENPYLYIKAMAG